MYRSTFLVASRMDLLSEYLKGVMEGVSPECALLTEKLSVIGLIMFFSSLTELSTGTVALAFHGTTNCHSCKMFL